MGKPAARIGDMHMCPMVTPGLPPIPHVGGPIVGPGCPTVLIGGMPAAVMGDMCVCVGPPDTIVLGSTGVFIGGKPAARMGDQCAHGGAITIGCPTVLIGESSAGSVSAVASASVAMGKADTETRKNIALMHVEALTDMIQVAPPEIAVKFAQMSGLKQAAIDGAFACEVCKE